jgi:hypothetical protein
MDTQTTNHEYHDFLDELTERRFFGEATFYFQGGNIESSRLSERNTKSEIRERMQVKKRRKVGIRHAGGMV